MQEQMGKGMIVTSVLKKVRNKVRGAMEDLFREMNLTSTQGMLIGTLAHFGEMKVSELSKKLGLSNSTVSGIIDRLEKQGFVERTRSEKDRRVVYIKLSSTCSENSRDHYGEVNRIFEEMMNKATPDELDDIIKGLRTLERVIDR